MKESNSLTSACRYCRHYSPEGRRGGMCERLGVLVQASWKSCAFALPPFETTWEKLQDIVLLENSFSLSESETKVAEKSGKNKDSESSAIA